MLYLQNPCLYFLTRPVLLSLNEVLFCKHDFCVIRLTETLFTICQKTYALKEKDIDAYICTYI